MIICYVPIKDSGKVIAIEDVNSYYINRLYEEHKDLRSSSTLQRRMCVWIVPGTESPDD